MYIEDKDMQWDPLDGLGDVLPWALRLRSSTKEGTTKGLTMYQFRRDSPQARTLR